MVLELAEARENDVGAGPKDDWDDFFPLESKRDHQKVTRKGEERGAEGFKEGRLMSNSGQDLSEILCDWGGGDGVGRWLIRSPPSSRFVLDRFGEPGRWYIYHPSPYHPKVGRHRRLRDTTFPDPAFRPYLALKSTSPVLTLDSLDGCVLCETATQETRPDERRDETRMEYNERRLSRGTAVDENH